MFESDEGRNDIVAVQDLIKKLLDELPNDRSLPSFFYLASCHGNTPARLEEDEAGSSSAAIQLHEAGVAEVVGYFGPIADVPSTRAEEALYEAIAEGQSTRDAVGKRGAGWSSHSMASTAYIALHGRLRKIPRTSRVPRTIRTAWAQLVALTAVGLNGRCLYRPQRASVLRGPALKRSFEGFGQRRVLSAGFIGRRLEQHRIRQRLNEGARVFVFQGLGGLGKSTLAQRILPWLTDDVGNICTLWCQEVKTSRTGRRPLSDCWTIAASGSGWIGRSGSAGRPGGG